MSLQDKHTKTQEEQKDRGITFWTSERTQEKHAIDRKTNTYSQNNFYFISFRWKKRENENWNFGEICSKYHPLDWVTKERARLEEKTEHIPYGLTEEIYLVSWNEIPFSIYKKFKDLVKN